MKAGRIAVYNPRLKKSGNIGVAMHRELDPDGVEVVFFDTGDAIELTTHDFGPPEELPADGRPGGRWRFERKTKQDENE
jgi:hypothetical protein